MRLPLRLFGPLAAQGDAYAQTYLGLMNANGLGVPQDYGQAVTWYRKPADRPSASRRRRSAAAPAGEAAGVAQRLVAKRRGDGIVFNEALADEGVHDPQRDRSPRIAACSTQPIARRLIVCAATADRPSVRLGGRFVETWPAERPSLFSVRDTRAFGPRRCLGDYPSSD
jgi:hypothetical protein